MGTKLERQHTQLAFTILSGQVLSNAQNLEGMGAIAIAMPSAWTAADLMFQASVDGTTFLPVFDDAGARVKLPSATIATAVAQMYVSKKDSTLSQLDACSWIKLESSVSQGADRKIVLLAKA